MRLLLFSLFYFIAISCLQAQSNVSPILLEKDSTTEAVILLHKQLQAPYYLKRAPKTQKGLWVHNNGRKLADQSQRALHKYCNDNNIYFQSFHLVNALYVRATPAQIQTLSTFPEVKYIGTNQPLRYHAPMASNSRKNLNTWGLDSIRANRLHQEGITGKNVIIGGQDTGYEWEHPALKQSYRGYIDTVTSNHNYNWHDAIRWRIQGAMGNNPCGFDSKVPCDDNSHGTHTMGTAVGLDTTNINFGVAPGAKWIGCRNMDNGYGTLHSYLECFNWFLAPTDLNNNNPNSEMAPHVIINSWGCPTFEGCNNSNFEVLRVAISNLRTAGIVVVASAGNDGRRGCGSIDSPPAIYGESFVVGASDQNNSLANFSSRGPVTIDSSNRMKPDVVAPGVGTYSAVTNGQYSSFNGTSMAGPHVAGAVALLIDAEPSLAGQPDLIEDLLRNTAQPLDGNTGCGNIPQGTYPNHETGHGIIDLWAALQSIRQNMIMFQTNVQQQAKQLYIHPNPAGDYVNIYTPAPMDRATLSIYTLTGKLSLQTTVTMQRLHRQDISQLPDGAYVVVIQNNDNYYSSKLFKY